MKIEIRRQPSIESEAKSKIVRRAHSDQLIYFRPGAAASHFEIHGHKYKKISATENSVFDSFALLRGKVKLYINILVKIIIE